MTFVKCLMMALALVVCIGTSHAKNNPQGNLCDPVQARRAYNKLSARLTKQEKSITRLKAKIKKLRAMVKAMNSPIVARCVGDNKKTQSVPHAKWTRVNFPSCHFAPRKSVTVGPSWSFKALVTGHYCVRAAVWLSGHAWRDKNQAASLALFVGKGQYATLDRKMAPRVPGEHLTLTGGSCVRLNKGDSVSVWVHHRANRALRLSAYHAYSFVDIYKL